MAAPRLSGRMGQVNQAMAEGDTVDTWPGTGNPRVRPATSKEIGERLGLEPTYVRAIIARIRRQLGSQAR